MYKFCLIFFEKNVNKNWLFKLYVLLLCHKT